MDNNCNESDSDNYELEKILNCKYCQVKLDCFETLQTHLKSHFDGKIFKNFKL